MSDAAYSAIADSTGTGVVTFSSVPAGLVWVVSQMSFETNPVALGSLVTIRRNDRFISQGYGSASTASGTPFLLLNPTDIMSFTWTGMSEGDECIVTLYYTQTTWQAGQTSTIGIV